MKKVIFLVGPTGVGKTSISIKLAKKIKGEIICCDSMQIYKGMDVLTAQPSAKEFSSIPHHLFKIRKPSENFSVAQYRKLALKKIKEIHNKGKVPVFAGGTGLYVQALLDGLFYSPEKDLEFRRKLSMQAAKRGSADLYQRLKKVDPQAAGIIHKNDLRRIIRALEVFNLTGKTISELKKSSTGGIWAVYKIYIFCLFYKDRNLLYEKINKRVEEMFEKGLVTEVRRLSGLKLSVTAGQAIGIKHARDFIDGKYNMEYAEELLKQDTRRYAKRQLSWFRREKRAKWIALDHKKSLDTIINILYHNIYKM